jgi:hypothetical protein
VSFRSILIGVTAVLICGALVSKTAQAGDFQTTTEVFQGNSKTPLSRNHTIFKDNVVYDIAVSQPRNATIYDFNTGRITLLNSERQVKLTLTTQDALELATYLKTNLNANLPILRFCRDPSFETSYDAEAQRIVMRGDPLTYESKIQVLRNRAAVDDYAGCLGWATQLVCPGQQLRQDGDQLVVAATDAITQRVHQAVEKGPTGGGH